MNLNPQHLTIRQETQIRPYQDKWVQGTEIIVSTHLVEPSPLVAFVHEDYKALALAHGYRFVRRPIDTYDEVYARAPWPWLYLRVADWANTRMWRLLRQFYDWGLIGVSERVNQGYAISMRDLRPWPFGKRWKS